MGRSGGAASLSGGIGRSKLNMSERDGAGGWKIAALVRGRLTGETGKVDCEFERLAKICLLARDE
jgi:hypothetical protein